MSVIIQKKENINNGAAARRPHSFFLCDKLDIPVIPDTRPDRPLQLALLHLKLRMVMPTRETLELIDEHLHLNHITLTPYQRYLRGNLQVYRRPGQAIAQFRRSRTPSPDIAPLGWC
jgi:hypothetical protein